MKTLMNIARRIVPTPTLVITESIPSGEPVVFVANHEKNYGPAMMQLFFPISYRPWIIYNMLDEDVCKPYIQETFFDERLKWPRWLSKPVTALLTPLLVSLMHATNPVPVYRGRPDRIVETFRQSIKALENGDNLLIFPEKPHSEPFSDDVNEFFEGFLYLAKLYYRKTGKGLLFCPVSINPNTNTISVGKAVRFNSDCEFPVESERIRTHLMAEVAGLYNQPWLQKKVGKQEPAHQTSQVLEPNMI
ncbi:MAG: hypothetical protein H0S79_19795 [Anaerolineaceae bacterium]|nr:hypothetical protein [Anaerolineaceae bacterium]